MAQAGVARGAVGPEAHVAHLGWRRVADEGCQMRVAIARCPAPKKAEYQVGPANFEELQCVTSNLG